MPRGKLGRAIFIDKGYRLNAVNRVLKRLGYAEAEPEYLNNIIQHAAGADRSAQASLWREVAEELNLDPPKSTGYISFKVRPAGNLH